MNNGSPKTVFSYKSQKNLLFLICILSIGCDRNFKARSADGDVEFYISETKKKHQLSVRYYNLTSDTIAFQTWGDPFFNRDSTVDLHFRVTEIQVKHQGILRSSVFLNESTWLIPATILLQQTFILPPKQSAKIYIHYHRNLYKDFGVKNDEKIEVRLILDLCKKEGWSKSFEEFLREHPNARVKTDPIITPFISLSD